MNLKTSRLILSAIGCFTFNTGAINASTTVFIDSLTDGDRTINPSWFLSGTSGATANVQTSGPNLINGNTLFVDSSTTFQGLTTNFTAAGSGGSGALSIGESYILTLDIRMVAAGNVANGIRIGIGNSNSKPFTLDASPVPGSADAQSHFGYYAGFGAGTNASLNLWQDAGGGNNQGFTNGNDTSSLGAGTTGVSFTNGNNRSLQFEIQRTTIGALITASYFTGTGSTGLPSATLSLTDTSTPYFNFNQISIMSGAVIQDFSFDNVSLKFIPEPSIALLSSLGIFALLHRRRA